MAGGLEITGKTLVLIIVLVFGAIAAFLYVRNSPGALNFNVAGATLDREHPILRLDTFDALVETERAVQLGLVIAAPLRDDAKSRARLDRKLGLYRDYFRSDAFRKRYGKATPQNSKLWVNLHKRSDRDMVREIERRLERFEEQGIETRLDLKD